MRRITAMSRHRDHLQGHRAVNALLRHARGPGHTTSGPGPFWLWPPNRTRAARQVVEQLAQAEFDHEDLAALVSRPHTHMPTCESAGLAISMSGCSAERLEPGHLVLAGRRHDVHSGPVSCHCRDRGQGDQRHFLTGVQQGPRLPASEHAPGGLACRFPGARRYRAWKTLSRGHRRGAAAGVGRMRRSLPTLRGRRVSSRPGRPGRPGRCACRSDRREAAAYVDSGPWRCAPLERTGVPQPSQRPPR
jgi:hypothetical protein